MHCCGAVARNARAKAGDPTGWPNRWAPVTISGSMSRPGGALLVMHLRAAQSDVVVGVTGAVLTEMPAVAVKSLGAVETKPKWLAMDLNHF